MIDAIKAADGYINAWNARDEKERAASIASTYTEDAVYVDPARRGEGHKGLAEMIAKVHAQFPPAYRFVLKGKVDAHGDRARFQREAGGTGDAPLHFVGTDIIEIAEDGRIRNVTGFIDVAPSH
jgi:ketosteroid isomerase-like protein